jgi:DNA-binding NarL/FixJ family response regulator
MKKPEIIIVDDHTLFRSGLKYLLEESEQYKVVAEGSNGIDLLKLLSTYHPDLVILDINMPVMNGIEAARQALQLQPSLSILILSMYNDSEYYTALLNIGIKGFVMKSSDNDEFFLAIQKVLKGGTYFSQELLLNVIHRDAHENRINLSPREKEVLELIGKGYSNQEIGKMLKISQRTVERHRTLLLEKTGCRNSVSLIVFALKNKLISI